MLISFLLFLFILMLNIVYLLFIFEYLYYICILHI